MTARKVILSGYYGFNNAGDEAVLAALVQLLRQNIADVEPVALSADPAATERRLAVRAINRWDKAALKRELADAALFCSGGGRLLQDVTSVRSVYYYTSQIKLAQKMGVPTMVLAQGLGPLNTGLGRMLAVSALKKCRLLSWRDEKSAQLAAKLGLAAVPNYTVCDPVLLWQPKVDALPKNGAVALALRPWPGFAPAAAAALVQKLQAAGEEVLLVPFYYGDGNGEDEKLAAEINSRLGSNAVPVAHAGSPEEVFAQLAACKFVVGMRLHALIMAAAANVPAVAVNYDPKVAAFADSMGIKMLAGGVALAADEAAAEILAQLKQPPEYPLAAARAGWQPLFDEMNRLLG